MKKSRGKRSIYARIISTVLFGAALTILMCVGAIYLYLEPMIRQSLVDNNRFIVTRMAQQLGGTLDEISAYARNITFDDMVQQAFSTEHSKEVYNHYAKIQMLERKLNEYVMLRDNIIYCVFLVDREGRVLETNQTYTKLITQPEYADLMRPDVNNGYTAEHMVNYNAAGSQWRTVAYISNVFNKMYPNDYFGKLVMLVNYDALVKSLKFDEGAGIDVELRNETGQMIFQSDSQADLAAERGDTSGNHDLFNRNANYFFEEVVGGDGWHLLYAVRSNRLERAFAQIDRIIIGITLICMVVMLMLIGKLVSNIVNPLERLIRSMQQVSRGSRSERVEIQTGDEIEEAARAFNQMVADIDTNTQKLVNAEKEQSLVRLKMLLYQINPHFIYNTLNCVICLARGEKYEDIIKLTRTFILLLRTILTVNPKTRATLSEEKQYINNYVNVLKYSYHAVNDVVWDVDDGLDPLRIPKLLLYPLVENSIFYGVLPMERECEIVIRIKRNGDWVDISVEDNGRGMDEQTLASIIERFDTDDGESGHIGLANVNSRLKLFGGENSGLSIESKPMQGAKMSFRLPAEFISEPNEFQKS